MTGTNNPTHIKAIWWLLLWAVIIRLAVAVAAAVAGGGQAFSMPDSAGYIGLAEQLVSVGRFETDGQPELYRMPGYPVLMMVAAAVGRVEFVTVAAQIFLSCLTVYLVFRIGLLLTGDIKAGKAAAFFYAIEPLSVLYCSRILSETLFTAILVASVFALLRYLHAAKEPNQTGRLKWLVASAILAAAAGYVRPIAYWLAPAVGGVLIVWALKHSHRNKFLWQAGLFIVVSWGAMGLWQLRNYVQADYAGFSAVHDEWLYFYQGAAMRARQEGVSYYEMQRRMGYRDEQTYLTLHPQQSQWNRAQRYRFMRREGWRIVSRQVPDALAVYSKGVLRTMFDPGGIEYCRLLGLYPAQGGLLGRAVDGGILPALKEIMRERPNAFWVSLVLGLILLDYISFSIIGLLSQRRNFDVMATILLVVVILLLLLSGGPQSEGRFRQPIMPILCVFAGIGWLKMISRIK